MVLKKVEEIKAQVESLIKEKMKEVKENYLIIYKDYDQKELIRDNKLRDLNEDMKKLQEFFKSKSSHIYIYYKWLSYVDYEDEKILNVDFEITEENYDYNLEVLPPFKMDNVGFYMSEFLSGNITNYFYTKDNKYFVTARKVKGGFY